LRAGRPPPISPCWGVSGRPAQRPICAETWRPHLPIRLNQASSPSSLASPSPSASPAHLLPPAAAAARRACLQLETGLNSLQHTPFHAALGPATVGTGAASLLRQKLQVPVLLALLNAPLPLAGHSLKIFHRFQLPRADIAGLSALASCNVAATCAKPSRDRILRSMILNSPFLRLGSQQCQASAPWGRQ
jgi:hypothetical protein